MAQPELLTIREVKAALNLSEPRVHQLLASGELEGPGLPLGRKRHSPGAPRVTAASVAKYLELREAEDREKEAARPDRTQPRAKTTAVAPAEVSAESAKAAAQELKVKLDTLREELREERTRSKQLLDLMARLVDLLRSSHTSADQLNDVTDGYSQALTQLLSPAIPPPGA